MWVATADFWTDAGATFFEMKRAWLIDVWMLETLDTSV